MIKRAIGSKGLYIALVVINILAILGVFILTRHEVGTDAPAYDGLAEGILHGRYSFWWFLPDFHPDTFRNPGYPLFLVVIKLFTHSLLVVKLIQFGLYLAALYLTLKISEFYSKGFALKNIFLLVMLLNVYAAAYISLILPEVLTLFLLTAYSISI